MTGLPPRPRRRLVPAVVAVTWVLAGCGAASTAPTSAVSAPAATARASAPASAPAAEGSGPSAATAKGAYIDRATYEADRAAYARTTVVLFFHAPWCPSCRAIEKDIQARVAAGSLPAGLTLVKVDYDSSTDLKARYGVTVQDTFVRIGADGNAVGRPVTDPRGVDGLVAALA